MVEAKLKWTGGIRFEGESLFGHKIVTDGALSAGGDESGYKPTELLMFALAGCTGVDVVTILNKMRQEVTGIEIEVKGQQPEQFPKPFNRIEIKYTFRGKKLDRDKIKQAVHLSEEKYCSVSQTLKGIANIISTVEIIEE
ncbi:OsmC/Ohr family protein [Candidatus Zixiibacteriota bacterium]|nr:OsmC/Ohr family protein [candidate division Zixibacteria bacterium]